MVPLLSARLASTMLALASAGLGQISSVEILPKSVADRPFPVLREGRQFNIESRSLQFLSSGLYGHSFCELILFREPATQRTLSLIRTRRTNFDIEFGLDSSGDLLQNTVVSIDKDAMRSFSYERGSLLISESTARTVSLDAAQELALADHAASARPNAMERDWRVPGEHWIRLLERLPKGFTPHVAEPQPPLTSLRERPRTGRCWNLALEGPGAESMRISINESYDLTAVEDCAHPLGPNAHVRLPPSGAPVQVPALRNNQPTTIEFRSVLAQVTFPGGQTGRLQLFTLHDPRTRLFWWTYWPNVLQQSDSEVANWNQKDFLGDKITFITDDRIVVFSSRSADESKERYRDIHTAEAHMVSVLERVRGNIQAGRGTPNHLLDTSGIPPRFFDQCLSSMKGVAQLKRVARAGDLWKLTLSGTNGNSVVLSLNDKYETAGVQLSPEVPPASIAGEVRTHAITAQRNGRPANLELRELRIRRWENCGEGEEVTRAVLIFDPSTHLSWWREPTYDDQVFTPAIVETEDKIIAFSAAMPGIEVTESIDRHTDWNEFQSQIFKLVWQGRHKLPKVVNLEKNLPKQFLRNASLQVSPAATGWRIVATSTGAQTAVIELNSGYRLVRAAVQR